jgi:hypothetical protein
MLSYSVTLQRAASEGIGLQFSRTGDYPTLCLAVEELFPGLPAAESGLIQLNDTLVELNGKKVNEQTFDAIVEALQMDVVPMRLSRNPDGSKMSEDQLLSLAGLSKPKSKSKRMSFASMKTVQLADEEKSATLASATAPASAKPKAKGRRGSSLRVLLKGKLKVVKIGVTRGPTGLGIVMVHRGVPPDQEIRVSELVEGTPARECGKIKVGDVIVSVDGRDVTSLGVEDVIELLRPETVNLTFHRHRDGSDQDALEEIAEVEASMHVVDARSLTSQSTATIFTQSEREGPVAEGQRRLSITTSGDGGIAEMANPMAGLRKNLSPKVPAGGAPR